MEKDGGGNEKRWGKREKEEMMDGVKRDRYRETEENIYIKESMQSLES